MLPGWQRWLMVFFSRDEECELLSLPVPKDEKKIMASFVYVRAFPRCRIDIDIQILIYYYIRWRGVCMYVHSAVKEGGMERNRAQL